MTFNPWAVWFEMQEYATVQNGISWTEKKPNVNVLREGNVQRSLLKTIRKRQMEFLGHVCRRRGLEFLSLTGKVEGKRDRGKQRITFLDSLCNSAAGGQSKGLNFLKLSDDRDIWRGMAANVCSRSGTWWWWWWQNGFLRPICQPSHSLRFHLLSRILSSGRT